MPARLEEITAAFLRESFRFQNADGDTVIARAFVNGEVSTEITIKGQADLDELSEGQTYRFYGRWTTYKNKRTGQPEQQFAFQSFVKQAPHGREGVIAYLRSAGEGLGFGSVRAAKLWELYGSDAVQALRERPAEVAERLTATGLRLTEEAATKIAAALAEEQALEGCTLDLMDLLTGRGFPKGTARLAVRAWGNRAAQIIRRCPYKLMAFRGCGFKKTDALYLDLGLPADAIRRQGLVCWYALARDTEGHTHHPLAVIQKGLRENLPAVRVDIERALIFARKLGAVTEVRTNGANGPITDGESASCRWFAEGKKGGHESELAQCVADAQREPVRYWPPADALDPKATDHQRAEYAKATAGTIGILGGGPGCGKTWLVGALCEYLCKTLGADHIAIGAPTGKASVKITENLSKRNLPLRARTWHSLLLLLERIPSKHFFAKVLIGDESSMLDTDLKAVIFRARATGTHVLLVGDINQLPPVGHGAPLRDLIAAGLPYGELSEVQRNCGMIVQACHLMRAGKAYPVLHSLADIDIRESDAGESAGRNLVRLETTNPDETIHQMLKAIRFAKNELGLSPIADCQVVTAVNKKSPLSRRELNKVLQDALNPGHGAAGSPFRVGDKVVNGKNGFFPAVDYDSDDPETSSNDRGEVYVANGELGEVLDVQPSLIVVKLNNPARVVKVPRGKANDSDKETEPTEDGGEDSTGTGCSWELGYALSVHKSQGSEFPFVVVILDEYPGAKMICSREWIYTSDSRGKLVTVEIGREATALGMLRRVALTKRKTLLRERIHLARANDLLAEL